MKTLIITDDNAGFTYKEANDLGIKIMRMPIIIDGNIYYENQNIDQEQFFQLQENGANINTSQPSIGEIIELWEESLKTYDEIVYIPMSSGLSASCETASNLANDYKDKVFVVDNHRISVTLKSSVYDAVNLVKQNKTGKEIKEILEQSSKDSSIYIMVNTLKYLKKGGRITPAAALIGETLHLKPILRIDGGKLDACSTSLGFKKGKKILLNQMLSDIENKYHDVSNLRMCVAYTKDLNEALEFKKEINETFNIPIDNIMVDSLSLSVATHIGPGSLAIACSKIIE